MSEKRIDISDLTGTYNLNEIEDVIKEMGKRINEAKDMKLKTVEFNRVETETDIELPVYLYFQDELCNDQIQKIEADQTTTLKYEIDGFQITVVSSDGCINPLHLNSQTTKEHYEELYKEIMERLKND
jgi:hypothetical protein